MWTAKWKGVYNINSSYFWVIRQVVVSFSLLYFLTFYFYNDKNVIFYGVDIRSCLSKALQLTVFGCLEWSDIFTDF